MKREQGKKASQKRLNLTPFVWGRVKQGQAGSSRVKQGGSCVRSLEREFIKRVAEANSPEAARQIYAKWHGKFTPNGKANSRQIQAKFSQAKKAFFKS
ncbi:hypothetical protein IO371_001219 [Campylobacter upsaliensis]|nr:hypothetical protein [Campylobacter upsaliensis]